MYHSVEEFLEDWKRESEGTSRLFACMSDESLNQRVSEGGRTLGRLAWHITTSIPEMAGRTGLTVTGPAEDADVPGTAAAIVNAYSQAAASLEESVRCLWSDASLLEECNMYGEMWKNGVTLTVLIRHQIHHRAQMTVLMRQAELKVPGLYGPSKEEWSQFGMPAQD